MLNALHDVVVTGMGAVTPFGVGVSDLWAGVREGRSAVDWLQLLQDLDPDIYPVRYGAQVKDFIVDDHLRRHCEVRLERSVQMGIVAAREALNQAQLLDDHDMLDSTRRVDVVLGSGHGPSYEAEVGYSAFFRRSPAAIRPTTIPKSMYNSLSANISIHFGLTGANLVIAAACASGASAIALGTMMIRHGHADIVLVGGADSPFAPVVFACWTSLRVLARHVDPQKAARPFDRDRNGLVLGEAAAVVVLESRESADRRGVAALAEVCGFGTSSDAFHVTAPTVAGQRLAMERCLADADLNPAAIEYINAHGTGTAANDATEACAITEVFGARGASMPVSSTKSMIGHSLGASGAVEFIICAKAVQDAFVPPTINCDAPDPNLGLDYVPHNGRRSEIQYSMSNSFAFGGSNVALIIGTT